MGKISFGLWGYRFKTDDNFLYYQNAYAKSFKVLKSDIESVSLDQGGFGNSMVKINGKGTLLAEVKLPTIWASKLQNFILKEIGKLE